MNCKTKKFVYRIGSVAGYVELNCPDYPDKNYYIKVRKGLSLLFYTENGEFSDKPSEAISLPETVSYMLANEFKKLNLFEEVIPMRLRKDFDFSLPINKYVLIITSL